MRAFSIMAAVMLALAGCSSSSSGDDTGGPADDLGPVDVGYQDLVTSDEGEADALVDPDTGADVPQAAFEIAFLSDSLFPQQVPAGQNFTIRARVRDTATQQFAAGRRVDFEITYIEALDGEEVFAGDSELTKASAVSDADGLVETVFQGGATVDLIYTVTATSDGANPATIRLVVLQMECGCLSVSLEYVGTPGVSASYLLYALPSDKKCADLDAATPLTGVLAEAVGLSLEEPVQFTCPPPNATVTLVAKGVENCPFAFGCIEGVVITGDKATETTPCPNTATVELVGTELILAGAFTGSHRLDVAGAYQDCAGVDPATDCASPDTLDFGRLACCYLRTVEEVFENDGDDALAAMQAQADAWEGTLLTGDEGANLDAALAAVVPAKVAGATPGWVAEYAKVAAKVLAAVRQINLNSTMTFQAEEDGEIPGSIVWTAYNPLYWKVGCDPADPQYFACGKLVLAMEDFGDLPHAPTIEDSTFTATLAAGRRVVFADHDIGLNLGKLIVFFAENVASRMFTGGYIADGALRAGDARSLEQAVLAWIPCEAIATDVFAQVSSWFKGTQEDLQALCEDGAKRLLAPASDLATSLTRPMHVTVGGSGAYSDQNCDMNADRITQDEAVDTYAGTFHPPAGAEIEVTGSLTANRK